MALILKNNATSRLGSSLAEGATSLSLQAGGGANFPEINTVGDWFPITVVNASGQLEVMKCTARTGDVLTVQRAQESTVGRAFAVGDRAELRLTVATLATFMSENFAGLFPDAFDTRIGGLDILYGDDAMTRWRTMPIGIPFPLWDHITGMPVPPTDNAQFRYIKLTAADAYNDGALTSETVSGSAPLITASAQIAVSGSPINGQRVALLNTEKTFLRPGTASGTLHDDALQNITGQFTSRNMATSSTASAVVSSDGANKGAFDNVGRSGSPYWISPNEGASYYNVISLDASRVARTDDSTYPRHREATFYMRVK